MSYEISSFRQSRNKLNMFDLFWHCRKDEISFDIVAETGNIVVETGNIVVKNSNNVEATFDIVERTTFYNRIVRHCCRLWQQSRTLHRQCCLLLRHCCWCGRGLSHNNLSTAAACEKTSQRQSSCNLTWKATMSLFSDLHNRISYKFVPASLSRHSEKPVRTSPFSRFIQLLSRGSC